jgi:hypothetical protein
MALLVIFVVTTSGLISGCAGTAKGRETSVYSSLKTEEVTSIGSIKAILPETRMY